MKLWVDTIQFSLILTLSWNNWLEKYIAIEQIIFS